MTKRNENNGGTKAFVHPWKKHETEFKKWVKLVRRKRREDKEAIDRLVEDFYPTILHSAAAIVSRPEFRHLRLDGADLVGEWFVDMMEKDFCGYDARKRFYCYGWFLLVRKCANICRYESYRRCMSMDFEVDREDDPSMPAEIVDEYEAVCEVIRRLPDQAQDAILRKHYFGESSQTIAGDLGMTESAVNQLTCKFRKYVKETIEARRGEAA